MSSSSITPRRSLRSSLPPVSLQEEQANEALSRFEQRDVTAALSLSLQTQWEHDERNDEFVMQPDEDENEEEEEEKKEHSPPPNIDDGWTRQLRDIEIPIPRLRDVPNQSPPANLTPMHIFQYFISRDIMNEFARHTNDAAPHDWRPTTSGELYGFVGIHLFMSIVRLPTIDMYWSDYYRQSTIASLMSRDRFRQIQRFFRIVQAPDGDQPRNPVPHVRTLANKLNYSFAAHFTPTHYFALDEAMVAFKGRSPIKQYIPMKPHKWGYKIYCLASEDYLLHIEIYEGKQDDPGEHGPTHDMVIRMTERYRHQQLVLFTDSWFTSPTLMNHLKDLGIRLRGCVRINHRGLLNISKMISNQ